MNSVYSGSGVVVCLDEEVEHKDEIVQLNEEVLHARGQKCDDSISKLSVSELKGLVEPD